MLFVYVYCVALCEGVMDDAILVWHFGGKLHHNVYVGGRESIQEVDQVISAYQIMLKMIQVRKGSLGYFFYLENGELQGVNNDASTCLLLSILNEKKKANIYIICDSKVLDSSEHNLCEAKHGEGTSGCGFHENELGVGQSTTSFNNIKEGLADVELGSEGKVG